MQCNRGGLHQCLEQYWLMLQVREIAINNIIAKAKQTYTEFPSSNFINKILNFDEVFQIITKKLVKASAFSP